MTETTYIKIEIKGQLTPGELFALKQLLQNTADDAVMSITTDFSRLPEDTL